MTTPLIRLGADINILDKGTSLDVKAVKEYKGHVDEVKRHKMEVLVY